MSTDPWPDTDIDESGWWIECHDCGGSGEWVSCIDDLCYRQEVCIHGDPPSPCPTCKGAGGWERTEGDDEP